jgi:hypothetical protein
MRLASVLNNPAERALFVYGRVGCWPILYGSQDERSHVFREMLKVMKAKQGSGIEVPNQDRRLWCGCAQRCIFQSVERELGIDILPRSDSLYMT